MFWPRLQLTKEEKTKVSKYYDPALRNRVLRKIYTGFLALDATQRLPTFGFAIARRCRVFALTAAGDTTQFRISIQSSSGEQYFPDAIAVSNALGGYNQIPGSSNYPTFAGGNRIGFPFTLCPFVFEPNIVLNPNQVLSVQGEGMTNYLGVNYRIELCFHVWEFPEYYGGP